MAGNGARNTLVREQALLKAAALFADKGFASTSFQDVADAVGLSRPALYYYFKNKEEILTALIHKATDFPVSILEKHRSDQSISPPQRLKNAVRELVEWIIGSPMIIKVLESNESQLPPDLATEHHRARRRVLSAFVDMVVDGISTGDFRPVDPRLAAFALIGMGNWTAWWYSPQRERPAAEVANLFAELAVRALQYDGVKIAPGTEVEHAVAALRGDLLQLEEALKFRDGAAHAPAKVRPTRARGKEMRNKG